MLIDYQDANADSFFENFDQQVHIKSIKESPVHQTKPYYAEIPTIQNYNSKFNNNNICKSLERLFQQCNNNPTIKKQIVKQKNDSNQFIKTEEDQAKIILQKYIEPNRNHSFNQLKCLFSQKYQANKCSFQSQDGTNNQVNGSVSQRPNNEQSFERANKVKHASFYDNSTNKQPFYNNQKPQIQQLSYKFLKDQFNKKQVPTKQQSYLNQSKTIELHYIYKGRDNKLNNLSNLQDVGRKPSESIHYKQKNNSFHGQTQVTMNAYTSSMAQLLKPRTKTKINNVDVGLNQTQQINLNKVQSRQISLNRNVSNQGYTNYIRLFSISPFNSSRDQKQWQNLLKEKQPSKINIESNLTNYYGYFNNDSKSKLNNKTFVDNKENHRSNDNQSIYINFAEFKKAIKARCSQHN